MVETFFAVHEDGTFFVGKGAIGFTKLKTLRKSMVYWETVAERSKYKIYRTYINNGVPVTERVEQ